MKTVVRVGYLPSSVAHYHVIDSTIDVACEERPETVANGWNRRARCAPAAASMTSICGCYATMHAARSATGAETLCSCDDQTQLTSRIENANRAHRSEYLVVAEQCAVWVAARTTPAGAPGLQGSTRNVHSRAQPSFRRRWHRGLALIAHTMCSLQRRIRHTAAPWLALRATRPSRSSFMHAALRTRHTLLARK